MAYLDSNFDGIDAVLMRSKFMILFCANNMTSNIQHGESVCLGSQSQEPWGDGDWDSLHHRHTQNFAVEGFHRR